MLRVVCIFLFVFIATFFAENSVASVTMRCATLEFGQTELKYFIEEEDTSLNQDNSPFVFVYWDERVRTTLTGVHEQNRLLRFNTILKHSPLSFKCLTDSDKASFLYAEYNRPTTERFIVVLRKIRI